MSSSKPLRAVLIFCLLLAGCGKSKPPRKLYEKEGGFSFDPPDGWEILEMPGLKYHVTRGTLVNNFAPNINVVDETFEGSLEKYFDTKMESLKAMFKSFKLLEKKKITSDDGDTALVAVTENDIFGRTVRQTYYLFENGSRKYAVICTALAEGGEEFDALFEKTAKSFRMH